MLVEYHGKDQDIYHFMQRASINLSVKVIQMSTLFAPALTIWISGEFPDTKLEELYNEMFGWESYRKDARLYNEALEM